MFSSSKGIKPSSHYCLILAVTSSKSFSVNLLDSTYTTLSNELSIAGTSFWFKASTYSKASPNSIDPVSGLLLIFFILGYK
jgi:hypothetical protein